MRGLLTAEPSKQYHRTKLILSLLSTGLEWIYLLLLVLTPLAAWLVELTGISGNPYLHFLLFSLAAGLIAMVFLLPISFTSGYIVEQHYELSNQTPAAWAWEQLKGLLVGGALGLPLALVFYACLRSFGAGWWLPVGVVVFLFAVVLGRLAPILIFPLFYKFEPLADDHPLKTRIEDLCGSVGLNVAGVYRFNLSKTTKKANAAFTGLGRAKRVLLADTLLDEFPEEEIAAVVAHELGHFRLRHIWKGMALGMVLTFIGLYVVARIHFSLARTEVAALATLPWLALLLSVYGFVTGPLSNAFSRRQEFAADRYSAELSGDGSALADGPSAALRAGLERLAELNLADRDPHPVVEFLFHGHPSIKRRLAALEGGKHVAG
ncbi:MAG: M48 family metallopeptidase [Fidelibacterota bacterium]|nr:MAG: M48 family metallopeptidase [Candidatus Neomarinimicrobiota bacterium]